MVADVFEHLDAVEPWHEQVEQHDVGLDGGDHLDAFESVRRVLDLVAFLPEPLLVGGGNQLIIFDD